MNLAQCIDPDWVRARFPEMFPRQPMGGGAPLRVVDHISQKPPEPAPAPGTARIGVARRIRLVLSRSKQPLTAREIAERDQELGTLQVATAMSQLVSGKQVERTGVWGSYGYVLTKLGREVQARDRHV